MNSTQNATGAGSSSITRRVVAAGMILQQAELNEMPAPSAVVSYGAETKIRLRTLGDLIAWALWAEGTVRTTENKATGDVIHDSVGVLLDEPIWLTCVELASAQTCRRCTHTRENHAEVGCTAYKGHGQGCRCASFLPQVARQAVPA